jgi:hypothetical protein
MRVRMIVIAVAAMLVAASSASAQTSASDGGRVYLTPAQAIAEVFGDGARAEPDPTGIGEITYRVFGAGGALIGYAMVLEEKGKYRPITFLVGTDPAFAVEGVEVLVYREDRGGEVRHHRFLRQYEGKTRADPIRTHSDIVNITGATISVNALNAGVRRALETLIRTYGGDVSTGG